MANSGLHAEWWINSLQIQENPETPENNGSGAAGESNDTCTTQQLASIIVAANSALADAVTVLEQFKVEIGFNRNDQGLSEDFKESDGWSWLPTSSVLHKSPKDKYIDPTHKKTLKVEDIGSILKKAYRYLQMTAVGLEQIILDRNPTEDPLYPSFNGSRHRLRAVLTEVQTALFDHDMYRPSEEFIKMDIVPERQRTSSNVTEQNMRDWIIYTAYKNTLEYVLEVVSYLKAQLPE